MIAKLIAHGKDRAQAIARLAGMLDSTEVWPVRTNAGFLFNALLHPEFGAERIDTDFIERHIEQLVPDPEPDEFIWRGAAAVALAEVDSDLVTDLAGFRLNAPSNESVALGRAKEFRRVSPNEGPMAAVSGFRDDEQVVVFYEGSAYEFALTSRGSVGGIAATGSILSPMPGKIIVVEVAAGEAVKKGQKLLTLEAMKMEHTLTAPFDGTVAELNAAPGAQVQVEALLARIEAEKD
jgi:3-methylcrotonyl-CoA carboxylase alpha subunit